MNHHKISQVIGVDSTCAKSQKDTVILSARGLGPLAASFSNIWHILTSWSSCNQPCSHLGLVQSKALDCQVPMPQWVQPCCAVCNCLQLSATVCNCLQLQHDMILYHDPAWTSWTSTFYDAPLAMICMSGHIFEPSAVYIMVFPSSLSSWVKQSRMKELVTLNHMNRLPKVGPLGSRHINLPEAMKHLMWHPICNPTSATSYKIPQNASIQNVTRKKHKRRQHVAVTISNCYWGWSISVLLDCMSDWDAHSLSRIIWDKFRYQTFRLFTQCRTSVPSSHTASPFSAIKAGFAWCLSFRPRRFSFQISRKHVSSSNANSHLRGHQIELQTSKTSPMEPLHVPI